MTRGKHIWAEIDDLKEALSQLTDNYLELEKVVKQNSCEIGRISATLEVMSKTAEESLTVEKDSKKEFWEYVLSNKAGIGGCRGFRGGQYCYDRCPYGPDGHRSCQFDATDRENKKLMQTRAKKELGLEPEKTRWVIDEDGDFLARKLGLEEPEPEKMLYLVVDDDEDLCICYGSRKNTYLETMWSICSIKGWVVSDGKMPDLWTEWVNNGCKFDPNPIKWKGKDDEMEYLFVKSSNGIELWSSRGAGYSMVPVMNVSERLGIPNCMDSNIFTDHEGRAFII